MFSALPIAAHPTRRPLKRCVMTLIDTAVTALPGRGSRGLPYVLIAEADVARAAWCLQAIRPFKLGALVARDGDEAATILHRFGPPVLLISDISLPRRDGFVVMETLRTLDRHRTPIVALSPFSALSGYAARRKDLTIGAIVVPTISTAAFADVIERLLRLAPSSREERAGPVRVERAGDLDALMRDASEETVRITGVPGVADQQRLPARQHKQVLYWQPQSLLHRQPLLQRHLVLRRDQPLQRHPGRLCT